MSRYSLFSVALLFPSPFFKGISFILPVFVSILFFIRLTRKSQMESIPSALLKREDLLDLPHSTFLP